MKYILIVIFSFLLGCLHSQSLYYISDCWEERIMEFDDFGFYVNDVNGFYEYTSDIEIDDSNDLIYYPGVSHPLPNYSTQMFHTYNGNIIEFALDEIEQKVYFWSQSSNTMEVIDYNSTNQNTVFTHSGGLITGVEFDMISKTIYYTYDDKLISYNLASGQFQNILSGIPGLAGLTLDIARGKIYYLKGNGSATTLHSCHTDGSNNQQLLALNGHAVDVEIDFAKQRLVWFSDAPNSSSTIGNGVIESCDFDGANRSVIALDVSVVPCPGGIGVHTVGCDVNLVLSNPELSSVINYITSNMIYSTSTIAIGSHVTYDSNCIVLDSGFECNGSMVAEINPCGY